MDNSNQISKILESRLMQYFGKISYGLYVWHMMAISIASLFMIESWFINLTITFVGTILMAHTSYFYFERYFLKLK